MSTHRPGSDRGLPSAPRRTWRWWHVLLLVLAVKLVVVAVGLGLVVVSVVGGLDDLLDGDRAREDDAEVVAAREEASHALDADADRLAVTVAHALGRGAARAARGEVRPPCDIGRHNWKIDDDYDLACRLERVELVDVPDRSTFRADMVALDAALRADGWEPDATFDMHRVLNDYWDRLGPAASSEPGTRSSSSTDYGVDDLPSARYSRSVDGAARSLSVDWAEPGSPPQAVTFLDDWSTFRTLDGGRTEPAEIVGAIPDGGYAVVATESAECFRE